MIPYAPLNDLSDVFQGWPVLLGAVVAQSHIVRKAGLVACGLGRIIEELHSLDSKPWV